MIKDYFDNADYSVLEWPSQSPDLNPIEYCWGLLDRKLEEKKARPSSESAMMVCLRAGWAAITKKELCLLIDSMPRRVQAVIDAKGGPTKY